MKEEKKVENLRMGWIECKLVKIVLTFLKPFVADCPLNFFVTFCEKFSSLILFYFYFPRELNSMST